LNMRTNRNDGMLTGFGLRQSSGPFETASGQDVFQKRQRTAAVQDAIALFRPAAPLVAPPFVIL